MKIVIGKKYTNIHNRKITKVIDKIFFNIMHVEEGMENYPPRYTHYKTFQKNWISMGE